MLHRRLAAASIEHHGGRYLARGGALDRLEGHWRDGAVIIVFSSLAAARTWYRSPEYALALAQRNEAVERDLVIVEWI